MTLNVEEVKFGKDKKRKRYIYYVPWVKTTYMGENKETIILSSFLRQHEIQ